MSDAFEEPANPASATQRKKGVRRRQPVIATEPAAGTLALTVNETAYLLRVSPNTVWNLLSCGDLQSFTIRRRRLISKVIIENFIAQGGTSRIAD